MHVLLSLPKTRDDCCTHSGALLAVRARRPPGFGDIDSCRIPRFSPGRSSGMATAHGQTVFSAYYFKE